MQANHEETPILPEIQQNSSNNNEQTLSLYKVIKGNNNSVVIKIRIIMKIVI